MGSVSLQNLKKKVRITEHYEMANWERDVAGVDNGLCQQFLQHLGLVCSRTLMSMDTEDNVYAGKQLPCTAEKRRSLTHMLLSCLVSNAVGFVQKSSLCHIPQSCKAPRKITAVSL